MLFFETGIISFILILQKKYIGTKGPLGFCIPGMCIFDLESEKLLRLDKHYGRNLNCESVRDGNILLHIKVAADALIKHILFHSSAFVLK